MALGAWLHRRLAWLALCAMCMAACAPAISQLLHSTPSTVAATTWLEVCSAEGMQMVPVQHDGGPASPVEHDASEPHCGYCVLQQQLPYVPSLNHTGDVAPASAGRVRLGSGNTTVFARFIRDAHPTRAPPAFA